MATRIVTTSRPMTADADIVLNTASDATRAKAWLPGHVGDIALRAAEGRVEWRAAGRDGLAGRLRVIGSGTGASEAELEVEVDESADPAEVRETLDGALRALAAEVDQNFNVS
ncbi:hypothetical protein [Amycolatopsis sp. Hca4]|uniref:hypothetical protein n=1 Tax=unclassified Amycolatopsis TaxID=2618356 RepID=UPI001591AFC3|nr:hypothetical protein [Amycolatopsis sp. Hca4]QKV80325.1 hypothetical protein HUT10_45960 [Amycolatopsis sp. Hca4]